MTPIDKRKAELREYIEARAKATQGEWKYESGPAFKSKYHCAFVEDIMALESHEGPENEQEGNVRFSCKAANESSLIAEQLLECIEALSGCSDGNCILRDRDFGQHTNSGCRCKRNIKFLLNKIAGEK